MLGHASAAMTLDVYADLFDDDLDIVAQTLDRSRNAQVRATRREIEQQTPLAPPSRTPGLDR